MAYSSNWKALNSKLKKTPAANKDTKIQKKRHASKNRPSKATKIANNEVKKLTKSQEVGDAIPVVYEEFSRIQAALWVNEHDISATDVPQNPLKVAMTNDSKIKRKKGLGKYLAIDCEFVGVGPDGKDSALARVSIVNYYGFVILDTYVKPEEPVTDWRSFVSGVHPYHMKDAIPFKDAQKKVYNILKDKILVGHAVEHDLRVLLLDHPKPKIRDTSKYPDFKNLTKGRKPGLKKLMEHYFKVQIQTGAHSSVEDACATMLLFRLVRKNFEKPFNAHKYGKSASPQSAN